jgi:hypothetical protein
MFTQRGLYVYTEGMFTQSRQQHAARTGTTATPALLSVCSVCSCCMHPTRIEDTAPHRAHVQPYHLDPHAPDDPPIRRITCHPEVRPGGHHPTLLKPRARRHCRAGHDETREGPDPCTAWASSINIETQARARSKHACTHIRAARTSAYIYVCTYIRFHTLTRTRLHTLTRTCSSNTRRTRTHRPTFAGPSVGTKAKPQMRQ